MDKESLTYKFAESIADLTTIGVSSIVMIFVFGLNPNIIIPVATGFHLFIDALKKRTQLELEVKITKELVDEIKKKLDSNN